MALIDQKDREQALNPAQSFIVQAPAGSGKTGLLVRRVLRLLCVVEKPEEILAITFTRKATAEMRERILDALSKAEQGAEFESHEQDMETHARAALARNHHKQWQLLKQPQRLKIQTIDSLCAELVRKMPWTSRFGGMPTIETDLEILYAQAAQNVIQKIDQPDLQAELSTLLFDCNGKLQALQSRLLGMLYQREDWLSLLFSDNALDSREAIESHWLRLIEKSVSALEQAFGSHLHAELLGLARYAHENASEKAPPLEPSQDDALFDDSLQARLSIRVIQWQAIIKICCTKSGFRSASTRSISAAIGFPNKDQARTRMIEILDALKDDDNAYAAIHRFRQCPAPTVSDEEWERLQALRAVLPVLAQELYVIMAEQNCADYDELSRRAIDALGKPGQPTDLALIQDYQLKHILMDEFQDTSPVQLRLLERLTSGWQIDDRGRSLFLVGDPMQSIYGFRKADVSVFLKVREQGINDIRMQPLKLKVNFRSSPDIVDWVNQTMLPIFPKENDSSLARIKFSPSEANRTFSGAVHTHLYVADRSQDAADYRHAEALQILKHIRKFRELHPDQSIAVLARTRVPLEALAACFRESNTDFESVDLENLAEQSIVQDLIVLCGIFIQPMDTLAWLAVLRAPWCGLCLHDLTVLRESELPILQVLKREPLPEKLSDDGTLALQRLRDILIPLLNTGQRLELNDQIRRAWLALRGPACYEKHELNHVEAFFEVLIALEAEPYSLNRERLQQACRLHKSSSPLSAIKLMTFHKAKGLEFDHVILTGLAGKSGGDNRRQPLLSSVKQNGSLLIAPAAKATDQKPTKSSFIKQFRKSIEGEETARLLYVAVTRARSQLSLFATLKRNTNGELSKPQQGSLLHLLWPELETQFTQDGSFYQTSATVGDSDTELALANSIPLLSLPPTLTPLELPAAIHFKPASSPVLQEEIEFSWAREDARIIGLTIHNILEFTELNKLKSWKDSIDKAAIDAMLGRLGLFTDRLKNASRRVANILERISTDRRAYWLFDPSHRGVKCEWALSCIQEDGVANYIIDRSFIDETDTRWIIDFKTSTHEGSNLQGFLDAEEQRYTPQLKQYASLVRRLEPDREIRLGLYFPALADWREIDAND